MRNHGNDPLTNINPAPGLADSGLIGAIVESAMDAVITVDDAQRVVVFNKAAERVFGWSHEEAMGAPLSRFMPERFHGAHEVHLADFGRSSHSSRRMAGARVVAGLRRGGEEFPLEASISRVTEGGRLFFTVILRDVTERVRAEAALKRSREELREFALATSAVREQEKSRIARELHDELAQSLSALKMDLAWIRARNGADDEVGTRIASMQGLVDSLLASARRIASDLRPLMLDDLGLVAACDWLVKSFGNRTGIEIAVRVDGDLDLADPHATAVFRVLQESLTNITKHAKCSRVGVVLKRSEGGVTLVVTDDGVGFAGSGPPKANSYGVVGMRERAYLLGGTVSIVSAPGQGTIVRLELPEPEALQ
jgi:PAS domain S-box-containing protein